MCESRYSDSLHVPTLGANPIRVIFTVYPLGIESLKGFSQNPTEKRVAPYKRIFPNGTFLSEQETDKIGVLSECLVHTYIRVNGDFYNPTAYRER